MLHLKSLLIGLAIVFLLTTGARGQQRFAEIQSRVTEFTLMNGMKFIVLERHEAPVASFLTYADVGSVQESKGITGLAHIFEHMAFKGTPTIGTTNFAEERALLDRVDKAFLALRHEQQKGDKADPAKLKMIEDAFNLESERFLNPVLREFYKEKDVVMEERRMRTESDPSGKMLEEFLAVAYKAHPYGEPVVGHMSDLQNITRADAEAFYKKYYIPSNLTAVIVGDVNPAKVRQFA